MRLTARRGDAPASGTPRQPREHANAEHCLCGDKARQEARRGKRMARDLPPPSVELTLDG
jgi:hypothetical protein